MTDLDPKTWDLIIGVVAMGVMLAFTILAIRAANNHFGPNDPRRAVVSRVIVWVGTAILVLILLAIRRE